MVRRIGVGIVTLLVGLSSTSRAQPVPDAGVPEVTVPDAAVPPAAPSPPPPAIPPSVEHDKKHDKRSKKDEKSKKPKISGFIQMFYRHTFFTSTDGMVDAPNFRIQRARIAVEGDVLPWLGYDISIDPRSPDIAGVLRDAYITVKHVIPHHRIRLGQQKTQFGYENPTSSTRLWAVNRTEVSDNLSRGLTLRDVGIGVLGGWPLGEGLKLEDAITVVNGNGFNSQNDDTRRKSYWGRVGARYDVDQVHVRAGASGATGDFIDPADPLDPVPMAVHVRFRRVGGDAEVDTRWVFVAAELVWGRDKLPTETADELGYYVNVVGKTPYPVGPIVRYDVLGDEFQRYTFGAYYGLPDDRFRVLVNYEYRRLKDAVRGDDRLYLWTQVRF
jgi:phosphate-selective porin